MNTTTGTTTRISTGELVTFTMEDTEWAVADLAATYDAADGDTTEGDRIQSAVRQELQARGTGWTTYLAAWAVTPGISMTAALAA